MTIDAKPPARQDMTPQELLEHRDLQNAQLQSMMHIWDNAEDERWNDEAQAPVAGAPEISARINAVNATSTVLNGRTVIPAALRAQLGIKDGDKLVWAVRDDELIVMTRRMQLRRAQQMFQKFIPQGASLADELLAERKAEQAKEDDR